MSDHLIGLCTESLSVPVHFVGDAGEVLAFEGLGQNAGGLVFGVGELEWIHKN